MIVLLEEIPEAGLSVDQELTVEFLAAVLSGQGPETGFKPTGPARMAARFDKVGDKLLLEGDARLEVDGPCKRCLGEVLLEVPVHFELNLVPRSKVSRDAEEVVEHVHEGREGDGSFETETADEERFDGRQIDLDAIAREQILLALPMDAGLCDEACKGLCPVCGQDLNLEECGCERKVADPRWAALKDIKLT